MAPSTRPVSAPSEIFEPVGAPPVHAERGRDAVQDLVEATGDHAHHAAAFVHGGGQLAHPWGGLDPIPHPLERRDTHTGECRHA